MGIEPVGDSEAGRIRRIAPEAAGFGAFRRHPDGNTLGSGVVLLVIAGLVLSPACSKKSRSAASAARSAPVPVAAADAGATSNSDAPDGGEAPEPEVAIADLEPELPAVGLSLGEDLPLSFGPEEVATREGETALLDELIGLTLPDPPRELTHEEALLHTRSELPLVMNQHVERLINYFTNTTRGKATIRASMGRGSAYRDMIERILEEEEVPAELYYLAMAESGFRPAARSRALATGMWQFISSRGQQYGLRRDKYMDLRYDAETATRAAAKHLKDLHIEFGDWYLAMAAYNSGPNRVKSAIRRTGSRDYWTMVSRRALPRETRNYVPIILAMTYVGQNLDLFDLGEVDFSPSLEYDTVRSTSETSFALIADATGSSPEAIRELNLGLNRTATPPGPFAYDLRLPKGTAERFEREIALVPPENRLNWRRYEVRGGETLKAVASRNNVDVGTLASLNSLAEDAEVAGGMRLTVPTSTRLRILRYNSGGGAGGLLEDGTGRYRIASGDNLGGIARRFGTTVAQLMEWNGLPSTFIRAGRYLIVRPEGSATVASSSGAAATGRYTVRRGDSLSKIGARVGASVNQLRAWNGISGSTIRPGQVLKVPGPPPAPVQPRTAPSAGTSARAEVAPSPDHYRIRSGDNLSTIASRFGVSIADLRSWNGIRGTRITAGKYLIVRPPSSRPAPSAPATAQAPRTGTASRYTVRRGDTLGGIAEQHGVTAANLRAWNGIRGNLIHPGDSLAVSARSVGGTSGGTTATTSYRVQRGDSLASIAGRHGVSVNDLMGWNGLRSTVIHPGQTLTVHGSGSLSYHIKRGDTLAAIAKRFNVSVNDLKRWNGLRSSVIHPGRTLRIQSSGS